ncbi:MAG: hypothetical protein EA382_12575 [Spirochaetaceae bacterium]|nr:MAG: hypothetical protein EA382_12575 [Spirochaetaceae bacterium]
MVHVLGVDIGSVSVATALVAGDGSVVHRDYRVHSGRIHETLRECLVAADTRLSALGVDPALVRVAMTASSPDAIEAAHRVDWMSANVAAHRRLHPQSRALLVVGGERFALIRFDGAGAYQSSRGNSSCAAGTGGFLDQQARRLGLCDAGTLAAQALRNEGTRPRVASRCSVFAKTDLIHAQQEGYSLPEICDGLCEGLVRNLADALVSAPLPDGPVVFAGGVARNGAVVKHVAVALDREVVVPDHAPVFAAIGAAFESLAGESDAPAACADRGEPTLVDRLRGTEAAREYYYPPLAEPTGYPDFAAHERFVFTPSIDGADPVEVDRYADPHAPGEASKSADGGDPSAAGGLYLGIDIGSTSTKAVLIDADGRPGWAFYTRTAGKPLVAVRALFEAIVGCGAASEPVHRPADGPADGPAIAEIVGVATTGSGRKFVGGVVGADLVLDEITAHARAAVDLDPDVDTIIEIGGQDAKFTTLRNGRVTFSQMNTVCAAGTGSFLEEQANRLGVPIDRYADRCIGTPAPLASDRCTVFMERDINHYLNNGFSNDEILTAAIHSVRENYLQKVAERSAIGRRICFQGATAKNRALVAAFEHELDRPIAVSRYCHVTGALGAALTCREEIGQATSFRGLNLYREEIPVRSERCELCTNHCRLRIATVGDQQVAFGFLCGRDYETQSYVAARTSGFDLIAARARVDRAVANVDRVAADRPHDDAAPVPVVGIPSALHLAEEHGYFRRVFAELGIPTVACRETATAVARGKKLEGAEFCSPIAAFHGHVAELLSTADLVFVPIVLERSDGDRSRAYCYYTQFTSTMLTAVVPAADRARLLSPVLWGGSTDPAAELHRALRPHYRVTVEAVRDAMARAQAAASAARSKLTGLFEQYCRGGDSADIDVVIVGRPYTAMDPSMNKGIPQILDRNGVRVFFQDMLPNRLPTLQTAELVHSVHWRYAADILLAADLASRTPGLYPVLVTSFKCAPDAFCQDAFKRIMDARDKPYLILQLDEHDSSVGYETRIEAAVRSFRNHHAIVRERRDALRSVRPAAESGELGPIGRVWVSTGIGPRFAAGVAAARGFIDDRISDLIGGRAVPGLLDGPDPFGDASGVRRGAKPIVPRLERAVRGKTLLLPNWDPLTTPLLAANLRGHGIDAVALRATPQSIQRSMRLNSGQCTPVSAIAQDAMDYVRDSGRPADSFVLWVGKGRWACGIPLYPGFIKSLFIQEGIGGIGVYVSDITFFDIKPTATVGAYFAFQFGGWLRRIGCMIRPYEAHPGQTDELIARWSRRLERIFENRGNRLDALRRMIADFKAVPVRRAERPKVAIIGDLYVRDNDVMNQNLIRTIEDAGGEALTTPYSDYVKIIASSHFDKLRRRNDLATTAKLRLIVGAIDRLERRYLREAQDLVGQPAPWRSPGQERELSRFGMVIDQEGESYENALKIMHLMSRHDDIALFVQASPAFCCPSMVTEALAASIEQTTGVPFVTVTYDGTESDKNAAIVPYIRFARRERSA